MTYIANKLEALDEYFESKSSMEKWIMIIFFAGGVAFLAYSYFYPYAKKLHTQSVLQKKTLTKKIHEEEQYLQSISKNGDREFKVKQYSSQIAKKKEIVKLNTKKIAVIDENLNKLSALLFNKKSWSLFIDSITDRASFNSVEIVLLENRYADSNGSFGHVLEVGLKCKGDFKDIVNFINDLEQNTLVTDVYSSKIYTDVNNSTILSDINISVWGVNH